MTVSTTTTKNSYSGNGSTTAFAYGFKILTSAEITVHVRAATGVETLRTAGSGSTQYAVTGVGSATGGAVTFVTAPAAGETAVLRRLTALTQSTDYVENDPFPAESHETALDKLTAISQEQQEEINRSVRVPVTDDSTLTLPSSVARASKFLLFDASGDVGVASTDTLTVSTLQAFTDYQVSTFTANGSTTAFTLSAEPGQRGNTQVYLNGVYTAKSAYTVVGAVLTFASAPGNTVKVEVVHGQAASTFAPDDGSITYAKLASASLDTDLSSVSGTDNTLPSAKAVKTYVDAQVTAADLDFAGGSGTGAVDLDAQTFTIAGTTNEVDTSASGQTITIGLPTNVTVAGEISAASLDVSGAIDVDGTTNLDAVDIDGVVQLDGTLTVGVDDTGYDVKLFGATASAHLLWDASADKLLTVGGALIDIVKDKLMIGGTAVTTTAAELNILDGVTSTTAEINILDGVTSTAAEINILDGVTSTAAEINILDGVTSTAAELNILDGVTSTAAELNILDGVTSTAAEINILDGATVVVGEINALDLGSTAVGTAIASKAVVLDSNKDYTGLRNVTLSGELDAGSLDVSGNADIDGTLETDAISIGGVTVTSTAAELNILDGVTSTAAELNILDGVTSTAAEINILDGVTSTAGELNILDGVTAVVGEINALDLGSTAVGTAIASKAVVLDSDKDYTGLRNVTATGAVTAGSVVVANAGNIGSAGDADAMAIASDGVVTFSQAPVFPDGSIAVADLDIDGATDIGAALVDADLLIVDDGGGGTNRKMAASRLKAYISASTAATAADDIAAGDAAILLTTSSGDITIDAAASDSDIILRGTDGGADTTFLTIDGSAAGAATFNSTVTTTGLVLGSTAVTSTAAELNILDGVTSTATELNLLDGVTSTTAELNILDGVTSTAAELNILDGVTSTAAELNILDGVTSTAAEINILDGVARGKLVYGNSSAATAVLAPGSANQVLTSDGTDISWADAGGGITVGTAQATGSNSSVTFTGIAAGTNKISIAYFGVTFSTSAVARLRLGDSGGIESSGYLSSVGSHTETTNHTDHMALHNSGMTSVGASCLIQLMRVSGNSWAQHSVSRGNLSNSASGTKTLSGELTQVQIFSNTGNFTAGTIQIITE